MKVKWSAMTNLYVPLLAHGVDHTPLNGPPAGTTDRHAHLVMARQAEELSLQLSGISCQLLPEKWNRKEMHIKQWGADISNEAQLRADKYYEC